MMECALAAFKISFSFSIERSDNFFFIESILVDVSCDICPEENSFLRIFPIRDSRSLSTWKRFSIFEQSVYIFTRCSGVREDSFAILFSKLRHTHGKGES